MIIRLGFGAALLAILAACGAEPPISNDSPEVAEDPPLVGVATIEATELAALIEEGGVQLIDVRSPEEFASGHIDGAINIPAEAIDPNSKLPINIFDAEDVPEMTGKQTILYCRSGRRSEVAAEILYASKLPEDRQDAYFDHNTEPAVHLAGGIIAWREAGYETVKPER